MIPGAIFLFFLVALFWVIERFLGWKNGRISPNLTR
jgi:hypothetical protein